MAWNSHPFNNERDNLVLVIKHRIFLKFILLCLALLMCSWRDCHAQKAVVRRTDREIKSTKSKLEQIEEEIEATDRRARGLKKKELSLVLQIQDIERKIDRSKKTLKNLNGEIADINAEISYINSQLAKLSEKLARKKMILNRRLREIYKRGRLNTVAVLLGSHSFTDLIKRVKYLTLIAAQDKRLVEEVSQLQYSYEEYRRASQRKLAQRMQRKAELEEEQQKLEQAEKERQKLLRSVKAQRAEVLNALEERRTDRERMKKIIAELERRRKEALEKARREGRELPPETAYLEGKMGSLNWPVSQGKLIRGFGPYMDKITKTRVINNGIEIKAKDGTEVRSVGSGSVVMADFYRSYGKMVMLNHGSGMYTIYAHLGDIFVQEGDFVTEGQAIATVGSTGSLEGPMLYFELRDGPRAVDPLEWFGRM